ncbi:MAG: DUF4143 domain-containing protein [Prevotella sp.]|nr:DUF4143 domain-containing protein [Prevotella sp.]
METIVYIELLRRCRHKGWDVYYYNDRTKECDFVVCHGNTTVMAIQVSYDILNVKTRKREISGLLHAARKTKCKTLILLIDHQYEDVKKKRIHSEYPASV